VNTPPSGGTWLLLADVALFTATLTALALLRRRVTHAPVALYLMVLLVGDWFRRALALALVAGGPYDGLTRLAFHADELLYLLGPAGLAACALLVLANVSARGVAVAYAVVGVVLIACYPELRQDVLRRVYLAAELGAVVVVLASAAAAVRRRPPARIDVTVAAVLAIAVVDGVKLAAGPFHRGDLFSSWGLVWPMHVVLYTAIAVMQGGAWWQSKTRR
jgi:hypothetical protein